MWSNLVSLDDKECIVSRRDFCGLLAISISFHHLMTEDRKKACTSALGPVFSL